MRNRSESFLAFVGVLLIIVLAAVFAGAQTNVTPSRITQAIDPANLTILRGNTHPLAQARFDRGAAPSALPMQRMLLVLKRSAEQEAALDTLMEQQQDASSPNYHHWLTPQQFGQQFGPSDQDIQTITSWLQSEGFQVNRVSNGRTVIEFSGTAGEVQSAFHTAIHQYLVNGENHWANSSDPAIPAALTPVLAGIDTLHNFPRRPMHHVVGLFSRVPGSHQYRRLPGWTGSSLFTGGSGCGLNGTACYAVAPYDFATIYNVLPLWSESPAIDGTGETIALIGQSDIYAHDVSDFRTDFGLPQTTFNIIHAGPDPGNLATEGDELESDLDVEWAGSVAKGATLDLVVAATTNTTEGVDLSALYAVDNNVAPIISESYGLCEFFLGSSGNQFYNQLWQQAAAQGVSVFVSTGDSGSAVCDRNAGTQGPAQFGLSVNGISSTPYDVAVGGTDFDDLGDPLTYWNSTDNPNTLASAKGYIPETSWNDSCTNQEVINFFGLSTAEETCNSPNVQSHGFAVPAGASGGESGCTTSDGENESSCSGGYPKPVWQIGAGVPSDGRRDVPDVSLFAADGMNASLYIVCESDIYGGCTGDPDGVIGVGGTSASTPTFAGIMALVDQKTNSRQGNPNYVLYQVAAQPGAPCNSSNEAGPNCIFNDVTKGTIAMPCATGSPDCNISVPEDQVGVLFANSAPAYNTGIGYDLATGLGSVNANNLVDAWATFASSLKSSSTSLVLDGGDAVTITHGQTVNLTAAVAAVPPASGTPTGSISLIAHTGTYGQEGVQDFQLSGGTITSSTSELPGGTYSVTAHYPGDGTFAMSDSASVSVIVNPEQSTTATQIFTIDQKGNSVPFVSGPFGGGVVYFRADVSGESGQGQATGTVNFSQTLNGAATTVTGNPYPLNSEGYTVTSLRGGFSGFPSPGTYSVDASYSGDASFSPSTSPEAGFTITKAGTTAAVSDLVGCAAGQGQCVTTAGSQVTIFASVSDQSLPIAPLPTGTETFYVNGTPIGPPVNIDSGIIPPVASVTTSQFSIGLNTVTVTYSGDQNYSSSSSTATPVDVVIPTSTALNTSATTIQLGQSVTLTAQVTAGQNGGPAPTGTVQFWVNNSNIGAPVQLSGREAALATSSLPAGLDDVGATYSGDTNYGSSGNVIPITVNGPPTFSVTANPAAINVSGPGQSGSTTLTFTGANGFSSNGTVALSPMCSGLPAESSCTPSPSSINIAANGTATATLTIATTAPSAVIPAGRNRRNIGGWRLRASETVMLAAILLMLCCGIAAGLRGHRRRWGLVLAVAALAFVFANAGCGGGGGGGGGGTGPSNPGTPVGSDNITVSVTINGVTQTLPLTVNVQ